MSIAFSAQSLKEGGENHKTTLFGRFSAWKFRERRKKGNMRKKVWVLVLVAVVAAFSLAQAQQQGQEKGVKSGQLPPEQALNEAPKIMGYDVAPTPAGGDLSEQLLGGPSDK